jgi:preprotein translocase SecE subunit
MNKISLYASSVAKEIKEIVWPSRDRVIADTTTVVLSLVIGGALIAVVDFGLMSGFQKLVSLIQQ